MEGPGLKSVPVSASCSENQGPIILAVAYSLLAIAIITVSLRLHLRFGLGHGIHSDDYTILACLVAGIIGTGCLNKLVVEGLGRHVWCLQLERLPQTFKWSIIAQICNIIGIGLAKISVCLCVLRIIDRTRRSLATFLWVVVAFASASHLAQVILFLVQCRPMAALWDPRIHGKCFSPHITYLAGYIGFGLDAFTDLVCAGIPIFILHNLRINRRTKLALCLLMGLGSLTAACAIAKAVTLDGVFASDYTWALTKPAICTIIEHLASMTLISLPALKPLFDKILHLSRVASSKRASRPYFRHTTPQDKEFYALKSSLRSDDTERAEIPLCDSILKTTHFHLSSSHHSQSSRHLEDAPSEWLGSARTASTEPYEKSMGNSWSTG